MIYYQPLSLITILLLVSIFFSNTVHANANSIDAGNATTCSIPNGLVDQLLSWIAINTNYDVSATRQHPPNIKFCETGDVIPYEGEFVTVEISNRGAYDLPNRTIYLVTPWNNTKIYDQSVLLHELIHDVQHINRQWECKQQPEWEAYKLQELWLSENGVKSGFDWLHLYFHAKCPRDIHP